MHRIPFIVVDVFSATAFKGNPLAVVDTRDAQLTDTQMKLLTRQFNLSETTFFFPPESSGADFKLRSFLPDGREVFGAGHNILGVWWYLAHAQILDLSAPHRIDDETRGEEFTFHQELGGEVTPVKITRHKAIQVGHHRVMVSMRQAKPHAHAIHPDPAALALSIGLSAADIGFTPESELGVLAASLQPQVMSTSTTRHLLVPLSSIEALNLADVRRHKLLEQLKAVDDKAYGLFSFAPVPAAGNGNKTFQARFFSPSMSSEDPATGSAAGSLSAYLYEHGVLKLDSRNSGRITVYQGLRVGRECNIVVELTLRGNGDGTMEVDIIGTGVQVTNGRIVVPDDSTVF
ncbi:phenazine biosynthesis protein [Lasiosphaeris hirsuta]|uniref:Phenazine biosynthesis protein n=1 Tax=Lasiosphaeris hirsuta TaxID=260670 RepID=A0AA40DIT6_9PEZI|nr:phenazine biosynthesis protein [Lasiosphaeris hirsuta]